MSETTLNYTTAAIEDLARFLAGYSKRGDMPETCRTLDALVRLMREAVKFMLPDHGELVALETLDEAFSEFLKLPFDAVCLEAPFPADARANPVYEGDDAFKETLSTRRIAVAWTSELRQRYPDLCHFGERKGFYVTSVYYNDEARMWMMCPLGHFVPNNPGITPDAKPHASGFRAIEDAFVMAQNPQAKRGAMYDCEPFMLCSELTHALAQELGAVDLALARLSVDLRDETNTAIAFCLTVNASNISRRRVEAPAKLNKKRVANGRVPFFDSWVLELGGKPSNGSAASSDEASSRESPRMHLRRGHLRRLGPERITFVRATTVGSPRQGVVDKSYSVGRPQS